MANIRIMAIGRMQKRNRNLRKAIKGGSRFTAYPLLEEFSSLLGKGYTHINLLYARENDRDALLHSNSDFIREQLELTYDTIVKIAPLAIFFFSDYCQDMIFGADRWVDPATEKDGHYILRGTNIPILFTDDITVIDDASRMALIRKLKTIIL